jgi:hypothetical protein
VSLYVVVFEWPDATHLGADTRRLDAAGPEEAKVQAAVMFASDAFEHGLPGRYCILNGNGATVFRYPEDRS